VRRKRERSSKGKDRVADEEHSLIRGGGGKRKKVHLESMNPTQRDLSYRLAEVKEGLSSRIPSMLCALGRTGRKERRRGGEETKERRGRGGVDEKRQKRRGVKDGGAAEESSPRRRRWSSLVRKRKFQRNSERFKGKPVLQIMKRGGSRAALRRRQGRPRRELDPELQKREFSSKRGGPTTGKRATSKIKTKEERDQREARVGR